MIYELEKRDFYKCRDLASTGGNIEEKAIIDGQNPGRVFVDNILTPTTAMIWQGNLDGFIFIGDPKNNMFNGQVKQFIDDNFSSSKKTIPLHKVHYLN